MEAAPPVRPSLGGLMLKLPLPLAWDRARLYELALLKLSLLNCWLAGLVLKARGPGAQDPLVPLAPPASPGRAGRGWVGLLRGLLLLVVLLGLLGCRLLLVAGRALGALPGQALRECSELLTLLWRPVRSCAALACDHLLYLVTWTTCLTSHLLQAAFEHTARLAQAQDAPGSLSQSLDPQPPVPEAGPVLAELGSPGE
ncbi:transmembrane protein 270 [Erinaceus europaeus]|uniref:Transmembrane protein 270 n=1 Tax=Erinaceus europaeus TaxID=9365 RepID=A0A1S2ZEA5_ERIEU|nr:transmembrane protein 270 [Erinaceus europaeus]